MTLMIIVNCGAILKPCDGYTIKIATSSGSDLLVGFVTFANY